MDWKFRNEPESKLKKKVTGLKTLLDYWKT